MNTIVNDYLKLKNNNIYDTKMLTDYLTLNKKRDSDSSTVSNMIIRELVENNRTENLHSRILTAEKERCDAEKKLLQKEIH